MNSSELWSYRGGHRQPVEPAAPVEMSTMGSQRRSYVAGGPGIVAAAEAARVDLEANEPRNGPPELGQELAALCELRWEPSAQEADPIGRELHTLIVAQHRPRTQAETQLLQRLYAAAHRAPEPFAVPLHRCPAPEPGGPAVQCGDCRTWRAAGPDGSVTSTPAAAEAEAQLMAENRELAARVRELEADLHDVSAGKIAQEARNAELEAELHPPPPATADDLDPGWWGQPDPPVPAPPKGVCRDCGLGWPPPDRGGLCRYCRLAEDERRRAEVGAAYPDLVALQARRARRFNMAAIVIMLGALIVTVLVYITDPVQAAVTMLNALLLALLALIGQRRRD